MLKIGLVNSFDDFPRPGYAPAEASEHFPEYRSFPLGSTTHVGREGKGTRSWASGVSRQAGQTPPNWVPETRWLPPSSSQHGPLSSLFPTL